jgi:hypothetical protein
MVRRRGYAFLRVYFLWFYFCLQTWTLTSQRTLVGFLSAAMQHGGVFRMGMMGMGMVLIELPD